MTINEIETEIKEIENEKNYYALFPYTYERAVKVREKAGAFFHNNEIDDIKFREYCERINVAKTNMIKCIKEWIVKRLEMNNKTLTKKEIVYSTVNVLFKEDTREEK